MRSKPLVEALFLREKGRGWNSHKEDDITLTHMRWLRSGQHLANTRKLLIKPSAKSIKSVLRNVRAVSGQQECLTLATSIGHLNTIIRGWAMYHDREVSAKVAIRGHLSLSRC